MIDTHCHIYLEQFENDLDDVLGRAAEVGVEHIYMPAINLDSLPKMDRLKHEFITFYKMAGLHPTEINEGVQLNEKELLEWCQKDDVVAVGETGLDYYWDADYKNKQQENLHMHCRVAKSVKKPVVLHNRESTSDLLKIIEEEQDGTLTGIWHCFTGTVEEGKKAIDLGLLLGIGGVTTFKNAGVDKTVAQLPLEKMVLETDAPYLAPAPKRGKRNEPAFIKFTAQKLAELFQKDFQAIEQITSSNARSLFH